MKVVVAVYQSHEKALDAVKALGESGFPLKQVSLIGKVEMIDNQMSIRSLDSVKNTPILVGSVAGSVVGLLSGLGIFAIPGFGFLYGAGAVVGIVGGFDLGIVTGGLVTLLATYGIKKDSVVKYEESILAGNFLVIVQGDLKEVKQAERVLHTEGKYLKYTQLFREYIDFEPEQKLLKNKELIYNSFDS
jgi:hypothetical protein